MVVLPGGMPGAGNLAADKRLLRFLRGVWEMDGFVAAICAAPIVLKAAGLLKGRRMTAYPSFRDEFGESEYTEAAVERDGTLITGSGPGTAQRFAVALVEALGLGQEARELRKCMLML